MNELHHLTIEADDGMDVLFVCPVDGCGRRVVVRRSGELIVLDKGDFYALHVGGPAIWRSRRPPPGPPGLRLAPLLSKG
jgi:hypothetical protein